MLAEERKPDALDAFRVARRWFMAGRRIEMQELAAELGVNRATLFRWVGGRDDLLGEILWSLAEPTLAAAVTAADGNGAQRITGAIGHFAAMLDQADFLREFVRREPERALRILTTRAGTVRQFTDHFSDAMNQRGPRLILGPRRAGRPNAHEHRPSR